MAALTFRAVTSGEQGLVDLASLNAELLREEGSQPKSREYLEQRFLGWITGVGYDKHEVFLVLQGDSVVGFFTYRRLPGEGLLWLRQLYVLPEYRRRGIATQIVETLKSRYPSDQFFAVVTKTNVASRQLFDKLKGNPYAEVFALVP